MLCISHGRSQAVSLRPTNLPPRVCPRCLGRVVKTSCTGPKNPAKAFSCKDLAHVHGSIAWHIAPVRSSAVTVAMSRASGGAAGCASGERRVTLLRILFAV